MNTKLHHLQETIYQITGQKLQTNPMDSKRLERFEKDINAELPEDFKSFSKGKRARKS